jgi:uncharacterized protein (DUF433 family)
MSTTATQYAYLAPNPKSSYRQLFVKGTRIRARILYGRHMCEDRCTVEQIAEDFQLPIEAVREAIAYCESDPPEIREDWQREEERIAASPSIRP